MPVAALPNLIPALPEIVLAVGGLVMLMAGVFQNGPVARVVHRSGWMGIGVLGVALISVLALGQERMLTFGGMFAFDPFVRFAKILVLIGAAAALAMSGDFLLRHRAGRFEYAVLVVFSVAGMMMMLSANDLIALYVGLEMQSLPLYVMATVMRDDSRASEAGLKYFVLGALASGMLLYGSSLIYGFAGTTNFEAIAALFRHEGGVPPLGVTFGLVFILAGLAFKVSAVPFHMWTPDVYEGAPTPVTAFFSVAPKIAALGLFTRLMMGPFGGQVAHWQQVVALIAVASMVVGAFGAINQANIKRLMAYSSISHVGYALVGLAVADRDGIRGLLVYLAIYLVMNLGVFACIIGMRRSGRNVESISDLAGVSRTHPLYAAALAILMFSMAGIPPLAGFFGKLYVFLAAVQAKMYVLATIGLLTSAVAAFYYIRIIRIAYFDEPAESLDRAIRPEIGWIAAAASLLLAVFFLGPGPLLRAAAAAAAALFPG
ncbi:MAG: NADH-quinone oxidoreductase subunit NuoN [Alphaproteobacteria bacterium]|nr:NADH-quinone oxidoreductase subunit NuoN [Alphaproteobacteria bacterium]